MSLLRPALLACCLALVCAPAQAQMDLSKMVKAPPSWN